MKYSDILSNENIKRTLISMVKSGKIPSASVFEGTEGSGRSLFASVLAKSLLCSNTAYVAENGEGCGKCLSCEKAESGTNPDLEVYDSPGGAQSFHVDAARELSLSIYLSPAENERRVIVVKNLHDMTVQAQNALLKSIEEPPKNVSFIITAAVSSAVLDTVRSRAAVFATEVIEEKKLYDFLERKFGPSEKLLPAVKFSNGTVGGALKFLEDGEDFEPYEYIVESVANCLAGGSRAAAEKCALMKKNYKKNETAAFFSAYESALRDIALCGALINSRTVEYIESKLAFFGGVPEAMEYAGFYSTEKIMSLLKISGRHKFNCGYNVSVKLNFAAFLSMI